MKKMFKKVLAIFMTAVISLTALGITAGAARSTQLLANPPKYSGSSSTSSSVTLEWLPAVSVGTKEVYYYGERIFMLDSKTGKYKKCKDLKYSGTGLYNTLKYTVKGLKANTTYSFKIATLYMVNGSKEAAGYTDVIKVKTKSSTSTGSAKLPAPTNLSIVTEGANSVSMKWDAVKGAEKYQIYYKTKSFEVGNAWESKYKKYGTTTKTSATVKNLVEWADYKFIVRAVSTVDGKTVKSKFSSAKTVKARGAAPYGKPVVYLYPEAETDVSVSVDLSLIDGEMTCSYPEYENGWNVTADPDGTLYDENGNGYYCLYWEGVGFDDLDCSSGWCVPGKDTAAFLREKLLYIGLNEREANEFIIYWLPVMQENPYNIISFHTDDYCAAVPMNVSPAPDSVIRVFMTFEARNEAVEVAPQTLPSYERNGFTLVEWGGRSADSPLYE